MASRVHVDDGVVLVDADKRERAAGTGAGAGAADAIDWDAAVRVTPHRQLSLEEAVGLAASQTAYLAVATAKSEASLKGEAARLRRLAKRSRLSADDTAVVVALKEELVRTQAELDRFRARIAANKQQFAADVMTLQRHTQERLAEIDTLKARVAELEASLEASRQEKLRMQDGAAAAVKAKDEEISKLSQELLLPRRMDHEFEEVRDAARREQAEATAAVERVKAEAAAELERMRLQYAQDLFIARHALA